MRSPDEQSRRRKLPRRAGLALVAVALVGGLVVARMRTDRKPEPAVESGKVIVAIYDDGHPVADRWVVFHDPRRVVAMKSGADGKASSEIHRGGMITVAYGDSIQHLITVTAVQPGDEIVIGERDNDEGEAGNAAAMAKIVLPGPYPSANRYSVSLGVGATEVAQPDAAPRIPVLQRLVDPKGTPTLALALDSHGEPLAFSFTRSPIVARDGEEVPLRLPPWSTDWRDQRIILSNAPAHFTRVVGSVASLTGAERFELGRREALIQGETSLRFLVPRGFDTAALFRLDLADHTSSDKSTIVRRASAMQPDERLDLRELLLPPVSRATVERPPDLARPIVRWQIAGDARKADAAVIQLSWPATREHVWTIITPPTTASGFEVPELPAVLADWRPDHRPISVAVALVKASAYRGYDDVRRKGIHLIAEAPEDPDATIVRSTTGGDIVF